MMLKERKQGSSSPSGTPQDRFLQDEPVVPDPDPILPVIFTGAVPHLNERVLSRGTWDHSW